MSLAHVLCLYASRTVAICAVALTLSSCGGGGGGGDSSPPPAPAVQAPSAPIVSYSPSTPAPSGLVNFSATSTDPGGLALTYEWDFGDGTAKVTGPTAMHAFASANSYAVKVTATNSGGKAASTMATVVVANSNKPPSVPSISATPTLATIGQVITFTASATDPAGLPISYAWNFGDGTPSATGATVTHAYSATSNYTVSVTATNSIPLSSTASQIQNVTVGLINPQVADCASTGCGATSATTYSGSGVGVWKYTNTSAGDQFVNFNISGVSAGKKATLVFSNGTLTAGIGTPGGGVLTEPAAAAKRAELSLAASAVAEHDDHSAAHSQIRHAEKQMLKMLRQQPRVNAEAASAAPASALPRAVPAVGTTRTWNDLFPTTYVSYPNVAVERTCATSKGRNIVFWLDPNATTAGNVTTANLDTLATRFCGATGAFAQLVGLLGDAWGPASFSNLIKDTPLQDINIVILNVPATTNWAGYFFGNNAFVSTGANSVPGSNEAVAFFINADQIRVAGTNFISSTLIHEATHMINFYQRSLLKNTDHDSWLEETSAMMSEDTLSNAVFGTGVYNKITGRTQSYLATGGGIDYVNWPSTATNSYYNLGGAFGAYLNRRYGLAIVKGLVSNCNDGSGTGQVTSYACLDNLIKTNGGTGFADDYARFGASVFARIPATGQPANFGYPAKADGGYTYSAFNTAAWAAPPTTRGSLAATQQQHYITDTIAAGKTSYTRAGVLVPVNTTMMLVIQ